MREDISHRTRIFVRVFDQFLFIDWVEFDLIEAGRDSRLQTQINPIQQRLFWFGNGVFRITRLFFEEAPKKPF